ncbi:MAG TPA: ABC transporter substrate-binding protein [Anaerolinea thermolimosa]|uniref:ABC transporter substrate-binding protein n=1 Tax=Anaerolinea thermolimosa TaxID=229919 RepID=A0A3D1JHK4_9CHLR|nr:zinc ABC transporter substrate-binding protein [Anaerolinea thermolimosa]GAP08074.1 ABC-type metal ion transport system, periplasmic component/surface adhesin [Anaerolinea thermolimosa]HCE17096.1 ABC transporter substrate-binding protein [Anaerolinea thermolimosa]
MKKVFIFMLLVTLLWGNAACQPKPSTSPHASASLKVLAVETFLADIARQVAGDRLSVESLLPIGLDPHAFEPTPQDVARIADSQVLIINGAGFETWLQKVLQNAGGQHLVIEASAGLTPRQPQPGEPPTDEHETDPHFWLDPTLVIHYVETIRDGLIQADPSGKEVYTANAAVYIDQLRALDSWIQEQVNTIPPERRILVTNHESFGYFADRYGFRILGTLLPSVTTGASPSAMELASLADHIRQSGAPAIFLETGANPQLADQISRETGVKVVSGLFTHSITPPDGPAPSYLAMMRYNVTAIVTALR